MFYKREFEDKGTRGLENLRPALGGARGVPLMEVWGLGTGHL
jgi:hypothetical protein